ncbi:MAG: AgmX/PglI C-terminal domain-containing protein [Myxococcota bacterium]|nr:AgmX/PglI C-terminal domain-containing protein [Deltaproteobacteria bacterium]MDQ3341459.1 AgmX/PglI C-terminal domain-containing protein [Myxococcota bacterium]
MKWFIVFLVACGGGQKAAPKECETGRCLEDIAVIVQTHRPEARACYDNHGQGEAGGRVIINFEIDPAGAVVDASKSVKDNQIDNAEVVACIIDVIKEIKFEASAKGKRTRAYHTFEFAPPRGKS